MQPEIVIRERQIPGAESVLAPAPLKVMNTEMEPIEVDLSQYAKFGQSKDFEYYRKIKAEVLSNN